MENRYRGTVRSRCSRASVSWNDVVLNCVFFALCLALWTGVAGQTIRDLDSHEPVIDSFYVASLCDSAWDNFRQSMHAVSLRQAQDALVLAESMGLDELYGRAVILAAYGYHNTFQHETAEEHYLRHMEIQESLGIPYDTFYLDLNIAKCATHRGHTPRAIEHFERAYQYVGEEASAKRFEYFWSLSFFFYKQKIYDRSVELRRNAHEVAMMMGDSLTILKSLNSLGFGYNAASQNDSAIVYLEQAVELSEQLGDRFQEWTAKACLGICHILEERYDIGIELLEEAQPIGRLFGEDLCCGNGAHLAEAYVAVGRMSDAYQHMQKARNQIPEIEDHTDKQNILKSLYRTYDKLGDSDAALDMLELLNEVEDEIDTRSYQAEVAEMDVRAKTRDLMELIDTKNVTIEDQALRLGRQRAWLFTLCTIITLFVVLFWYLIHKRKTLQRRYENEIQKLSALANSTRNTRVDIPLTDIQRIEKVVIDNLSDSGMRVSDVAAKLNFSQRRVIRVVRNHTGMTVTQMIIAHRIAQAKQLLLFSSLSIGEIAYKVGYNDPAYFSNVFRNKTGQSPGGWRKQMAQEVAQSAPD